MFGKKLIIVTVKIVTAVALLGCAEKNYAQTKRNDQQKNSQSDVTCLANFKSAHCVTMIWEALPTDKSTGTFVFKTLAVSNDGIHKEADMNGAIAVVLWMPSMGHGSSPVQVEHLGVGTYRATNVFFVMPGDWEIRIQLSDSTGVIDTAIIPFEM
jgi:hypothetical protein